MVKKNTHTATEIFSPKFGKEVDKLGIDLLSIIQEYRAVQKRKECKNAFNS